MGVFISPFVIFRLPASNRLTIFFDAVVVIISKNEPVVIEASSFHYDEELGLGKGFQLHWGGIVVGKLVVDLQYLFSLEVDDVDFRGGDV